MKKNLDSLDANESEKEKLAKQKKETADDKIGLELAAAIEGLSQNVELVGPAGVAVDQKDEAQHDESDDEDDDNVFVRIICDLNSEDKLDNEADSDENDDLDEDVVHFNALLVEARGEIENYRCEDD